MYGQYHVVERIAVGGMAEIYLGVAHGMEGFERPVVIKKVRRRFSRDSRFHSMLVKEAKITASLNHPNIVQILDLGQNESDEYFIVMEYVDGKDLRSMMDRTEELGTRLAADVVLYIASEICAALDYAHKKLDDGGRPMRLIHRDVSPSNILISQAGEVKLTDFGIARYGRDVSAVGSLKGKLGYMSPEQARTEFLDHRSDVFSLGAVMFESLLGRRVFNAETDIELLDQVRVGKAPAPSSIDRTIPLRLEQILQCSLAADPDDRFQTAQEMGLAIREFQFRHNSMMVGPERLADLLQRLFPNEPGTKPCRSGFQFTVTTTMVQLLDPDLDEGASPASFDSVTSVGPPSPELLQQLRDPLQVEATGEQPSLPLPRRELPGAPGLDFEDDPMLDSLDAFDDFSTDPSLNPLQPGRPGDRGPWSGAHRVDEQVLRAVTSCALRSAPERGSPAPRAVTSCALRSAPERGSPAPRAVSSISDATDNLWIGRKDNESAPTMTRPDGDNATMQAAARGGESLGADLELPTDPVVRSFPEQDRPTAPQPVLFRHELDEVLDTPRVPPGGPTTLEPALTFEPTVAHPLEDLAAGFPVPPDPAPTPTDDEASPFHAADSVALPLPARPPRSGRRWTAWLMVAIFGLGLGGSAALLLLWPGSPLRRRATTSADAGRGGGAANARSQLARSPRPAPPDAGQADKAQLAERTPDAAATRDARLARSSPDARPRPVALRPVRSIRPVRPERPIKVVPSIDRPRPRSRPNRGTGSVVIKSDPWAYIHVDGRDTRLTTSARPFSLPAGRHQIELVNPALNLRKKLAIEVVADDIVRRFVRLGE